MQMLQILFPWLTVTPTIPALFRAGRCSLVLSICLTNNPIEKKFMKNIFLFFLILVSAVFLSCSKGIEIPPYNPPVSNNFTVTSMSHTKDTVNTGDTVYLNVTGMMYDTLNVYAYFTIKSTATGAPVYSTGSSSSPIKINRILATNNPTDINAWTSTVAITGVTSVTGSKLTITGNFIYQLSLSSQGGGLAAASDGGVLNKTVFVQ
jgi:hypothetical protein